MIIKIELVMHKSSFRVWISVCSFQKKKVQDQESRTGFFLKKIYHQLQFSTIKYKDFSVCTINFNILQSIS